MGVQRAAQRFDQSVPTAPALPRRFRKPTLLITSDIHTIVIHTNFNNYPTQKQTITFDDILSGDGVQKLTQAFFDPEKFKPEKTQEQITKATADTLLAVAEQMKKHRDVLGQESYSNEQLAHFLVRLLFALFAEDMGLLPDNLFTQIVRVRGGNYSDLRGVLGELFAKMRHGGIFGLWQIRHFNGTLFDDDFVPDIPHDLGKALLQAAEQDWSQIDPSIFGTLFERVIDENKRAQLGAHYTSETDIMLIVEPVLMEPLKRKWDEVRRNVDRELRSSQTLRVSKTLRVSAYQQLIEFANEIAQTTVLDPACGSGNFLYVALRELLDLQKQVIAYAARKGLPEIELTVNPEQLFGIEINPYAHELAQVTVWIGYLQWRSENGFAEIEDPILRPLNNIKRMDAILAHDVNGTPVEPEWPAADVIIGNPPFLGGKRLRGELGHDYVENLFFLYDERVPRESDLVCYWFEKGRGQIEKAKTKRVGLIATNSIRGGANRIVLDMIKETGDLFMSWSDNPWILEGAAVRVSMIGFDDGSEHNKFLDGDIVNFINSDLTTSVDITKSKHLKENCDTSYQGTIKGGSFDITENIAKEFLNLQNDSGLSNEDVIKPWVNGSDIVQRPRNMWIIDFGVHMSMDEASQYNNVLEYVKTNIKPVRDKVRRKNHREYWWIHAEARPGMRQALNNLSRYIITPRVAKHRLFVWAELEVLPDSAVIAIARGDDYFLGVLHSRPHEIWSLRLGTWLGKGNDPRYTPTTTFETFPFPWSPGQEPTEADDERVAEIGHWARELVQWRQAWLNPPPPQAGVIDVVYDKMLKKRTLTNLYNGLQYYRETTRPQGFAKPLGSAQTNMFLQAEFDKVTRKSVTRADIQELDDIHTALDEAVLEAYGWPRNLTDEQILEHLLALNLERAAVQED